MLGKIQSLLRSTFPKIPALWMTLGCTAGTGQHLCSLSNHLILFEGKPSFWYLLLLETTATEHHKNMNCSSKNTEGPAGLCLAW